VCGRLPTDAQGSCTFETIRPGRVADGRGGLQAAHVNLCLFARGLLRHLYTRMYFAGDPALGDDALLAHVPEDRRETLLAIADPGAPATWSFAIRLQGDRETVFFDL
jgi:protocatechuate 3,4-dioxygenase alpha subunit